VIIVKTKVEVLVLFCLSITLILALGYQFYGNVLVESYEPHAADAMWVEPSSLTFTEYNGSIGRLFNITVWLNITSANVLNYQIALLYNRTQLRGVRGGFTNGTTSQFMQGHITSTAGPTIDTSFLGNGSVLAFETCLGLDFIPTPRAESLVWLEFEIISTPPESETFTSKFDITTKNPDKTWVYNPEPTKIPITTYDGTYKYAYTGIIIQDISRTPETPNYDQNVIVSATITDNVAIDGVLLAYTSDMAWHNISMNRYGSTFNVTMPAQPYETTVQYKIYANDTDGYWAESSTYLYTVADFVAPQIAVLWKGTSPYPYVSSSNIRTNEPVLVTANVYEPANASGVANVLLSYRANNSEWWNTTMLYNATSHLWTVTIPGQLGNITIEFCIRAQDKAGNLSTSPICAYNVKALIIGDVNGDGVVDGSDLIIVARHYGEPHG
jgi:hypothetical protein